MKNPKPIPGQCYKNAFMWAQEHPEWSIVHGILTNKRHNVKMGHAWNEASEIVYDPSVALFVDKDRYYKLGDVSYAKSYTLDEATENALKENNWGPWDEKIMKAKHANDK